MLRTCFPRRQRPSNPDYLTSTILNPPPTRVSKPTPKEKQRSSDDTPLALRTSGLALLLLPELRDEALWQGEVQVPGLLRLFRGFQEALGDSEREAGSRNSRTRLHVAVLGYVRNSNGHAEP